jgi:ubiquinone/menaquinone biosynthesis C-methylase UbiE
VAGEISSPVERWIDEQTLGAIYSSRYWNDLAAERSKEWWIADGDEPAYGRLRAYLENTALMEEYKLAESYIASMDKPQLMVADLASGIGWTSSLLSKLPNVARVHAVEISRHRLELLFPQAMRMFGGNWTKVTRNLGSFYDLKFDDSSLDVVFLSSAFHHAENPLRLLTEIDRVLRPGGRVMLIGETHTGGWHFTRRVVKFLLTRGRIVTNFFELFPPDDELGDHYYRRRDYYFLAQMLGYRVLKYSVQRGNSAAVVLEKNSS